MTDKFEIYDIIGVVVPGVLLVCVLALFFPGVTSLVSVLKFPEAFSVIALTALAVLFGHAIQALASVCEKFMYWSWGGRPSDRVFVAGLGDRYFPLDSATRIKRKLAKVCQGSDRSLFLYAMQRAESGGGRTARFNALFAYHRAILVLMAVVIVLFVASFFGGVGYTLGWKRNSIVLVSLVLFLILIWFRTRQRGFYYVREVLLKAEQSLEEKDAKPADEKVTPHS